MKLQFKLKEEDSLFNMGDPLYIEGLTYGSLGLFKLDKENSDMNISNITEDKTFNIIINENQLSLICFEAPPNDDISNTVFIDSYFDIYLSNILDNRQNITNDANIVIPCKHGDEDFIMNLFIENLYGDRDEYPTDNLSKTALAIQAVRKKLISIIGNLSKLPNYKNQIERLQIKVNNTILEFRETLRQEIPERN